MGPLTSPLHLDPATSSLASGSSSCSPAFPELHHQWNSIPQPDPRAAPQHPGAGPTPPQGQSPRSVTLTHPSSPTLPTTRRTWPNSDPAEPGVSAGDSALSSKPRRISCFLSTPRSCLSVPCRAPLHPLPPHPRLVHSSTPPALSDPTLLWAGLSHPGLWLLGGSDSPSDFFFFFFFWSFSGPSIGYVSVE